MEIADTVFLIIIVIFSAIIHEVMHGVAADKLGDPTARYAGRLTLNPIPHIDLFGSILLPLILALSHAPFFFAWAKPVPYNPYNLRAGRWSEAIVAGAGPASNLAIAALGALVIRIGLLPEASSVIFLIVLVNVMLFIFNLIPIPPLDGSKVIEAFMPRGLQHGYRTWRSRLEMNPFIGMAIVLAVVLLFGDLFGNFIYSIARALVGA